MVIERYNCICKDLGTVDTEVIKVVEPVVDTKPPTDIDKVSLEDPSEISNMVSVTYLA